MSIEKSESPALMEARQRATFFRQSGWLMIANILGGMLMWAVHPLAKKTGAGQYGLFVTYLAVAMSIPTLPLQMVLAQQTARAEATNKKRELTGIIRLVWLVTTVLWLISALAIFFFQESILEHWKITNPAGLWITLGVVLLGLWLPIFWGVLQGQQNFLWLGSSMLTNGVGRIVVASVAVLALGAAAVGMMTGVLLGMLLALAIALWQTRTVCFGPSAPFDWRSLSAQVVPLMLGFAAFQFLFTADTIFVKRYFDEDTVGFYGSAGTMARALMWLVGPLASVMFPRIVHSTARAEKSDLVGIVLMGTAILALCGAIGLCIVGPYVVEIVYGKAFVKVAGSILPWYGFAMVPLAVGNVLLNNLLARGHFKMVPALCILAIAYGFALTRFNTSLVTILQTLGTFNLLLFLVCAWYTWAGKLRNSQPRPSASI